MISMLIANANRAPNTAPIDIAEFMYTDPVEARRRSDEAMVKFMDSKVRE